MKGRIIPNVLLLIVSVILIVYALSSCTPEYIYDAMDGEPMQEGWTNQGRGASTKMINYGDVYCVIALTNSDTSISCVR